MFDFGLILGISVLILGLLGLSKLRQDNHKEDDV